MAKKEFTYRGKKTEEIKKMSLKELAGIFPASARRKIKRGFTEAEKKLMSDVKKGGTKIKTHCRDMIILPDFIGKTILVHSGKSFEAVRVTEEMIGKRFGEFVLTRKGVSHSAPGIGATRSSASLSVK